MTLKDDPLAMCHLCAYHKRGMVFDLCTHPQSMYKIADVVDFHTIGHMRTRGPCGEEGNLFKKGAKG